MYIAKSTSKSKSGKVYESILLRESYREGTKVKNRTLANLSGCSKSDIEAIRLGLKHKDNPTILSKDSFSIVQGRSVGGVFVLKQLADSLGITKALGDSFHAKLILWLVFARILEQGSRLSAARLVLIYDIASIINLNRGFDENDFYQSLHWVAKNQSSIENSLFRLRRYSGQFYWYDVTSSYFEGTQNALAAYGHNRDKKKRKKQVVIGLLSINNGMPVSVEAFAGNTQDTLTFQNQLDKIKARFGCKNVVLVGDRGMIRNKQKLLLKEYGFGYVTALTLPEMKSLIGAEILCLDTFTKDLQSICLEGKRYIYRRNPGRALETQSQREERLSTAQRRVDQENKKLESKPTMSAVLAKNRIRQYLKKLCIAEWVSVSVEKRQLRLEIDQERLKEKSKFDGCYVWTTELGKEEASDLEIFERYKDLKYVEDDFRTFKSNFLEIRPIYVRTVESTKGHIFITMLAHMIVRELRSRLAEVNMTAEEALRVLGLICQNSIKCSDAVTIEMIPAPSKEATNILSALQITMPKQIQVATSNVVTRHRTRKGL